MPVGLSVIIFLASAAGIFCVLKLTRRRLNKTARFLIITFLTVTAVLSFIYIVLTMTLLGGISITAREIINI